MKKSEAKRVQDVVMKYVMFGVRTEIRRIGE